MQLPYRQGVLRGQIGLSSEPRFLQMNGLYANIHISPYDLLATAAFGDKNYVIHEHEMVNQAWGPMPTTGHFYLFWDIDTATGLVTRGYTEYNPIVSTVAPTSPSTDQHWFDLTANKMNVWDGMWVEKIRVFAGTFDYDEGRVVPYPFITQAGLDQPAYGGYVLYDVNGRGVINPVDNTLMNTGDGIQIQLGSLTFPVSVDSMVVYVQASESLPAKSLISPTGENRVGLANYDTGRYAVGMTDASVTNGGPVRILFSGPVFNEQWDFPPDSFGKPVWLANNGELSITPPPFSPLAIPQQMIGIVLFSTSIILSPKF